MVRINIKSFLEELANKLDKRTANKKHSVENDIYPDGSIPKIPLIGGYIYIWKCYKAANNFNNIVERKRNSETVTTTALKDVESRKKNILKTLDRIYEMGVAQKISIEKGNESLLVELCESYNGLKALPLGSGRYTILVDREEDLLC